MKFQKEVRSSISFVSARSFYTGGNQAPPPKVQETKGPQKSRQPIKMSEMTPHSPAPKLSAKGSSPHAWLVFRSSCCFCFFCLFFFPYCSERFRRGWRHNQNGKERSRSSKLFFLHFIESLPLLAFKPSTFL